MNSNFYLCSKDEFSPFTLYIEKPKKLVIEYRSRFDPGSVGSRLLYKTPNAVLNTLEEKSKLKRNGVILLSTAVGIIVLYILGLIGVLVYLRIFEKVQ